MDLLGFGGRKRDEKMDERRRSKVKQIRQAAGVMGSRVRPSAASLHQGTEQKKKKYKRAARRRLVSVQ